MLAISNNAYIEHSQYRTNFSASVGFDSKSEPKLKPFRCISKWKIPKDLVFQPCICADSSAHLRG